MPYIQAPMDYLGFQAAAGLPRSLFPPITPTSLGLNPFHETYFPPLEMNRPPGHETQLIDHSPLTNHYHSQHLSQDTKLGISGAFDMKSLLLSGHNHCQGSNPNSSISCASAAYNLFMPCGCGFHSSAQTPSLGLQSLAMAQSSSASTSTIPSTSTSQLSSQSNSLMRPVTKLQPTQRIDERNKSNSETPSPLGFRLSHPTNMSNNSSASSSPSSPVPTFTASHLLGLYSHYFTNGKSIKCFIKQINSSYINLFELTFSFMHFV